MCIEVCMHSYYVYCNIYTIQKKCIHVTVFNDNPLYTYIQTEISWNMGVSSVSGHLPVIRSLPTVASSVRAGITAYCRGKFCNDTDVKPFVTLFALCGHVEEVPEKYLDAITSVSGSGLAFVSMLIPYSA